MTWWQYLGSFTIGLLISHFIRTCLERSNTVVMRKVDYPHSLFFSQDDSKKYTFAHDFCEFLNELDHNEEMSNAKKIQLIDGWLERFGQSNVDCYLWSLYLGKTFLPNIEDIEFDFSDKEQLVLKDRELVNKLLLSISQSTFNDED